MDQSVLPYFYNKTELIESIIIDLLKEMKKKAFLPHGELIYMYSHLRIWQLLHYGMFSCLHLFYATTKLYQNEN